MAALNFVFDGTRENFQQLVIENSHKGLVLANYWTPGAAPCFKLWQALESLTREFRGRFLLVNINTDAQKRLARENGITSVPILKLYRDGVVVESIYGAHSESALRASIEQHAPAARHPEVARAIRAYQGGRPEDALKILVNAGIREPDNAEVHTTAARLLLREARYGDLEEYVSHLPQPLQLLAELDSMRTHARLLQLAASAPPRDKLDARLAARPEDTQAALQRIAVAVTEDDYPTAFELLLRELKRGPAPERDFLHKVLRNLFGVLGAEHDLTRHYRKLYLDSL